MSTVAEPKKASKPENAGQDLDERFVKFVPLGSDKEITLTFAQVKRFHANKTKKGHEPNDAEILKFMKLCEARLLDPWVGDAYLTGYDTTNDGPVFNLITAHQALLKRAELNQNYDGMIGGVIVREKESGAIVEKNGACWHRGFEDIIGAWAKVFRKDRKIESYVTVDMRAYDTELSRWKKDPGGMIVKVAKSAALREAFPTQCGGLYVREEFDVVENAKPEQPRTVSTDARPKSAMELVKQQLRETVVGSKTAKEPEAVGASPERTKESADPATKALEAEDHYQTAIDECDSDIGLAAIGDEIENDFRLTEPQRDRLRSYMKGK
jgi:phage recombination protein Bet